MICSVVRETLREYSAVWEVLMDDILHYTGGLEWDTPLHGNSWMRYSATREVFMSASAQWRLWEEVLLFMGDFFEWDASAQWRLLRWFAPLLRETLSSEVLQLSEDFETFNPPVPKQKVRTSPDGAVVTRLNSCPLRVKTTGCQKGFVVRLPIESLKLPVLARTLCFSSVKTFLGVLIYTWDFDTNFHLAHQLEAVFKQ